MFSLLSLPTVHTTLLALVIFAPLVHITRTHTHSRNATVVRWDAMVGWTTRVELPQSWQLSLTWHCEPSDAQKLTQNRSNARYAVSWTHLAQATRTDCYLHTTCSLALSSSTADYDKVEAKIGLKLCRIVAKLWMHSTVSLSHNYRTN